MRPMDGRSTERGRRNARPAALGTPVQPVVVKLASKVLFPLSINMSPE